VVDAISVADAPNATVLLAVAKETTMRPAPSDGLNRRLLLGALAALPTLPGLLGIPAA